MPLIVGAPRSGTTLLRFMLDAHPDLAIPYETGFLDIWERFDPASKNAREEFLEGVTNYPQDETPTWDGFGISREEFRQTLRKIKPFTISEGYRAFYRTYANRLGKKRWGEKTPLYCLHMPMIERLLPEAHFIHIIRDGRDVSLSVKQMLCNPGEEIEARAQFWSQCVKTAMEQGRQCGKYMEVRYEDLILDPENILRKICDFIDLEYHPSMLSYPERVAQRVNELPERRKTDGTLLETKEDRIKQNLLVMQPPQASQIARWKTAMSVEDQRRFQNVAGDLLGQFSYELI